MLYVRYPGAPVTAIEGVIAAQPAWYKSWLGKLRHENLWCASVFSNGVSNGAIRIVREPR